MLMHSNQTTPFMNNKRLLKAPTSTNILPKNHKLLSLRLQFQPELEAKKTKSSSHMRQSPTAAATTSHQLNIFPLQSHNHVEDGDNHEHENVAYFFSATDDGATALTGLLDNATASNSSRCAEGSCRPEESEEGAALVLNVLRSRERDSSKEKWVCYSEVVEMKVKDEEVTNSVVDLPLAAYDGGAGIQRLSLKLDYDEILTAWSDKGPLYVHAESSRIVPDITCDFQLYGVFNNCVSKECNEGAWEVPEIESGEMKLKNGDELKMGGQREASMLRYKAKREKRLFSKKIRYQIRKLNAEKRPRFKGRFVKRS